MYFPQNNQHKYDLKNRTLLSFGCFITKINNKFTLISKVNNFSFNFTQMVKQVIH